MLLAGSMADTCNRTQNSISDSNQALELCCGGKNKCPVIEQIPGGFQLSEHGEAVRLTPEQAQMLADWLRSKLTSDQA